MHIIPPRGISISLLDASWRTQSYTRLIHHCSRTKQYLPHAQLGTQNDISLFWPWQRTHIVTLNCDSVQHLFHSLFLVTVGKYTIILSLLFCTLLPSCIADGEGALKVTLEKSSRRLQHWRGTTAIQELPLIIGPQVQFNCSKYHYFSISEHSTSMFYFIHKPSTTRQASHLFLWN